MLCRPIVIGSNVEDGLSIYRRGLLGEKDEGFRSPLNCSEIVSDNSRFVALNNYVIFGR